MKKFNYENKQYLNKLNALNLSYYSKYIKYIENYLSTKKSKYLDVGCGNGQVLEVLISKGYANGYGLDVSKLFVKEAKKKGLRATVYDGNKFPYNDNSFSLIASFNVLEHAENPEAFVKEQISKIKRDGIIIVACPNFLSFLFPNPHRRLKGPANKLKNLLNVFKKLVVKDFVFEKMEPVIREKFEYDDDAIVVTNLIDLKRQLEKNGCKILYESGFINYDTFIYKMINLLPIVRYGLPSCFVVARKNE